MDARALTSRTSAIVLSVVFGLNIYIGLYDTTLNRLSPLHYSLNWLLAAMTLLSALILLIRPLNVVLSTLGGIVWPSAYVTSIFVDVETKMCLGTHVGCWPSMADAYDYLILGSRLEGWVLWPYTMRMIIGLLVMAAILAMASLILRVRTKNSPD